MRGTWIGYFILPSLDRHCDNLLPVQIPTSWWDSVSREVSCWRKSATFWGPILFLCSTDEAWTTVWGLSEVIPPGSMRLPPTPIMSQRLAAWLSGRVFAHNPWPTVQPVVSSLLAVLTFSLCEGLRAHPQGVQFLPSDTCMWLKKITGGPSQPQSSPYAISWG